MNKRDKNIVKLFKENIPPDLSSYINRIIVFGSRARGVADEDSDLDIAVLVDEVTPEIEKQLNDVAYQIMWNNDFNPVISLKIFSEKKFSEFLANGFSFYRNVIRGGISV